MSLFRVQPEKPVKGPHQRQQTIVRKAEDPRAAMIMIHGRGATAEGIIGLAGELDQPRLHYYAPQAQGFTWYPNSFLAPIASNEPGISSGLQKIHDLIEEINAQGIPAEKVFLLGFSQGACLATEFAARHPRKYGGVIGLSGGLIGPEISAGNYTGSLSGTPVFLGCSDVDPHIPKERVQETAEIFKKLGASVEMKLYPGMGHLVNQDEIEIIKTMAKKHTGQVR